MFFITCAPLLFIHLSKNSQFVETPITTTEINPCFVDARSSDLMETGNHYINYLISQDVICLPGGVFLPSTIVRVLI
jgi:hypothetical protein